MCRRGVGVQSRRGKRPCQDCSECTFDCGDLFARKIDLVLPSGRTHYRTCAGGCVSALVVLLTLASILLHYNELLDQNQFIVQKAVAKNWYSESDVFPEDESQADTF